MTASITMLDNNAIFSLTPQLPLRQSVMEFVRTFYQTKLIKL